MLLRRFLILNRETLSGFVQYLGRTGKVRVDESEVDGKLYITWIDRNPEAMARAKKKQQKVNDTLDDIAANERLMKQRLKLAQASSSGSSVARSTARDDTAQGVQLDAQGNLVMRLGGGEGSTSSSSSSSLSSSSSSIASRKRPIDSRPTLNFGGHGNTNKIAIESTNTNNNNNSNPNETMTATSTTRATISFELPPTKRTKYDNQKGLQSGSTAPRSVMWMCEGLVVKIKNKTVGDGAYYKKKARISSCNNSTLTADVRVIDSGIKIRIHQKDLETVIPKRPSTIQSITFNLIQPKTNNAFHSTPSSNPCIRCQNTASSSSSNASVFNVSSASSTDTQHEHDKQNVRQLFLDRGYALSDDDLEQTLSSQRGKASAIVTFVILKSSIFALTFFTHVATLDNIQRSIKRRCFLSIELIESIECIDDSEAEEDNINLDAFHNLLHMCLAVCLSTNVTVFLLLLLLLLLLQICYRQMVHL